MDEAEFNTCTVPAGLLGFIWWKVGMTDRKGRLLLCACCRHLWSLFQNTTSGRAVEVAERQADGAASRKEVRAVRRAVEVVLQEGMGWREDDFALMAAAFEWFHFEDGPHPVKEMTAALAAWRATAEPFPAESLGRTLELLAATLPASRKDNQRRRCEQWQCTAIRDVFHYPLRPARVEPTWRTPGVLALARGIYEGGRFEDLPILADALEEAGADDAEVLGHLRQKEPGHVRGCWCLDLVLGKE